MPAEPVCCVCRLGPLRCLCTSDLLLVLIGFCQCLRNSGSAVTLMHDPQHMHADLIGNLCARRYSFWLQTMVARSQIGACRVDSGSRCHNTVYSKLWQGGRDTCFVGREGTVCCTPRGLLCVQGGYRMVCRAPTCAVVWRVVALSVGIASLCLVFILTQHAGNRHRRRDEAWSRLFLSIHHA